MLSLRERTAFSTRWRGRQGRAAARAAPTARGGGRGCPRRKEIRFRPDAMALSTGAGGREGRPYETEGTKESGGCCRYVRGLRSRRGGVVDRGGRPLGPPLRTGGTKESGGCCRYWRRPSFRRGG